MSLFWKILEGIVAATFVLIATALLFGLAIYFGTWLGHWIVDFINGAFHE